MAERSDESAKASRNKRIALVAAFCFVVIAHLILVLYAEQNAPIFKSEPLPWIDFDTHAEQVQRVTDALAGWGKAWGYDPSLLAGYPTGAVFEADNKGWELWTYVFWKLGMSKGAAFNIFVLFAHMVVPGAVYASARLFRLEKWEALLATSLAICLWFFDGLARWNWFSGGVAFSIVSFTFVLPIALFYSYLRTGRHWLLVPLALVMSAGHLIHPAMFVLLVVPMVALYARSFRKLGTLRHAAIVGVAVAVIASNAWWLATAFRFAHYVTDHEPFFVGKLKHLVFDVAELVDDLTRTGLIGNRTGFRLLSLAAGTIALVMWRKGKDDRFMPVALGMGALAGLAYLGGYLWVFRQIQSYRNVVPAAVLACIPAAALAGEVWRKKALHGLPRLAWAPIGLVTFLGASHLLMDALYFFPKAMPKLPPLPTGEVMSITAYGFPEHRDFRHFPPETHFDDIATWVREHDDGQGRFLVEWWVLGEHLLARTNAPILGGFRERNLQQRASNLFYAYPDGNVPDDVLAKYLEQYAVRWVIVTQSMPAFEGRAPLELAATVGPHRVFRSRLPVSYFALGSGHVRASLNRIEVEGTQPDQDIVLRFHWLETLVCQTGCKVVREPLDDNPVGFLRVPAPHPTSFSVVNGY